MTDRENRNKAFDEQLASEVSRNRDTIVEILMQSNVGNCGGKCGGFDEKDLRKLCPQCFRALEAVSENIFASSELLGLFKDAINSRD